MRSMHHQEHQIAPNHVNPAVVMHRCVKAACMCHHEMHAAAAREDAQRSNSKLSTIVNNR